MLLISYCKDETEDFEALYLSEVKLQVKYVFCKSLLARKPALLSPITEYPRLCAPSSGLSPGIVITWNDR